jgi:hypothetical protein
MLRPDQVPDDLREKLVDVMMQRDWQSTHLVFNQARRMGLLSQSEYEWLKSEIGEYDFEFFDAV